MVITENFTVESSWEPRDSWYYISYNTKIICIKLYYYLKLSIRKRGSIHIVLRCVYLKMSLFSRFLT